MSSVHLGLDTATPFLSVGLWRDESGLLAGRTERVERAHGAKLLQVIGELLAEAGVSRVDLATVSAGVGPGSYTGIKVGGAAATGLARALSIPLFGADTLAAMAAGRLERGEEAYSILDARRGNVYAGRYRREDHGIVTLEAPRKVAREVVYEAGIAVLEHVPPDPGFLASSGLAGARYAPSYL